MDNVSHTGDHDAAKIVLPKDPAVRQLIIEIMKREHAVVKALQSGADHRTLLQDSFSETENYLRATSSDPYYTKSGNLQAYQPGGWKTWI